MMMDELLEAQASIQRQKLQGDPLTGEAPQYCEIFIQELEQIPLVNIREKSPQASGS